MENYVQTIVEYVLVTIGFLMLFKKCGISRKWAAVPIYRYYKLAEEINMDEEGMTIVIADSITYGCAAVGLIMELMHMETAHLRTVALITVIEIVAGISAMIYRYRVFDVFSRSFGRKKIGKFIWTLLWVLYPSVPAIVWGFFKKYQQEEQKAAESSAAVTGLTEKVLENGLTINLTDRTVKNHLSKRCLLKDIHLSVPRGRMVLLLGGSGAGKTTFLNAVTGYEPANAEVWLDGENVYENFNRMKYKISFVPQQDLIRYEDTVQKTLMDAACMKLPTEYTREDIRKRVNSVLDLFGLAPVKDNIVGKQSGGQKKRISIAMEFLSDPTLFILDEPDSGLDGILARELMQRLHDISRQGKIVVVITHTPDRVIDLFDDVIVLGKDADHTGRLVYYGSVTDAYDFFQVKNTEEIVRKINRKEEGGEGLADELIEKYAEVCHGGK